MYFYDVPMLDFDPRVCIPRAGVASSTTNRDCAMKREDHENAVREHDEIVAAILKDFPEVTTFAPARYLCDDEECK
ncbi:acyltransferase, partial [Acinetobacter baumannii]|nr:acyltransferase [Acinetobacter baumannii]